MQLAFWLRRTLWDCWSPSTPSSQTPSISWTRPGKRQPFCRRLLDFTYLFQLLEDEGYQGFVGCEYRPRGDTVEGLSWLRSYWDRRGHPRTGQ
ncbi:hydroxypyruvate isomerase homolog (E. coli), isoform CRA_c [Mus musculus]|nr:hydroxypyruvate isomerase homolog (E. coli), isoform CRA_c [Mus musculus]